MRAVYINVEPRYTPGSPGAIHDEKLARRIAGQERDHYEHALTGLYGDEMRATAEARGLDLIVFLMIERPRGWAVEDFITGKKTWWPHKAKCRHCGKSKPARRGVIEPHDRDAGARHGCHDPQSVAREITPEFQP
jgi:hypothetical protein